MGLIGTLPRTSQTGLNEWSDVETNDARIRDEIDGLLDNANLKAGAAVSFAKLATLNTGQALIGNAGVPTATTLTGLTLSAAGAVSAIPDATLSSPNNAVYKTLIDSTGFVASSAAAATYILTEGPGVSTSPVSGSIISGGVQLTAVGLPTFFNLTGSDYTVGSLTAKLQLRAAVMTNGTIPAITFTFGLYPFTMFTSGAGSLGLTLGAVVPNSTIAIASPPANAITRGVTAADFVLPADGLYVLACVTSGALTANNVSFLHSQLQIRNV